MCGAEVGEEAGTGVILKRECQEEQGGVRTLKVVLEEGTVVGLEGTDADSANGNLNSLNNTSSKM